MSLNHVLFCISFFSRLGSKVKLSWKLTSITKADNQGYVLGYETPEGLVSVQAKSVIMTIPSYVASDILRPLSVSVSIIKIHVFKIHWAITTITLNFLGSSLFVC